MRKIIIKLLLQTVAILNRKKEPYEMPKNMCMIKADKDWLMLYMPDGTRIPGQLDLTINQPLKSRGFVQATVTVFVRFDNLIEK